MLRAAASEVCKTIISPRSPLTHVRRSCDHWCNFPPRPLRSGRYWSSSHSLNAVPITRTRSIPTTESHGCFQATAWKRAILLYILRGRSGARHAFFFRFGLRRIRDTVFSPRSLTTLLPDKRTHDHYQQSTRTHQSLPPLTFLRTVYSWTSHTRPVASCYATLASLRARPSLRRLAFHLSPRDSIQQAFCSSTPSSSTNCVVNKQ